MADTHPITGTSRMGRNYHGATAPADTQELFRTRLVGLVNAAYDEQNKTKPWVQHETLTDGKSVEFTALGEASGSYHQIGDDILVDENADGDSYLSNMKPGVTLIHVDPIFQASVFLSVEDMKKAHAELGGGAQAASRTGKYGQRLGAKLASYLDITNLRCMNNCARTEAIIRGMESDAGIPLGGAVVVDESAGTNADDFVTALLTCARVLDTKNVPSEGRVCWLAPTQYYRFFGTTNHQVLDKDFGDGGNLAKGTLVEIGGILILPSNHFRAAQTGLGQWANATNSYADPFAAVTLGYGSTIAVVTHQDAVGQVNMANINVEVTYWPNRLGWQLTAFQMHGHGVVTPQCAVEINTDKTPGSGGAIGDWDDAEGVFHIVYDGGLTYEADPDN